MKVFTATFLRGNYGSALQAYALQQKIIELGGEPIVIDRRRDKDRNGSNEKRYGLVRKLRRFFRNEKHYGPVRKLRRYLERKLYTEKSRKINRFVDKNVFTVPYQSALEEMKKGGCVLLAGSDQVWSIINHPIPEFFLFDFVENTSIRKVSYAASIGISELSDDQRSYYKKALASFDTVSFREQMAYDLLKTELNNRVVRTDIDPTLLFDASFWQKLIPKKEHDEKYLFIYMLRPSKEVMRIARKLAQRNGLKMIYMGLFVNYYIGVKTIVGAGVEDFLYYIKNAEIVVTNSFHGTVFSLLFEKRFVSVRIESTSSRAESLLKIVDLEDHLLESTSGIEVAEKDYDYKKTKKLIEEKRKESIEYLKTIVRK